MIITENNSLVKLYPSIKEEWNCDRNKGLIPENFTYGSEKVVWWKCGKCGYEWESPIYYRTTKNCGCKNCNSLLLKNPELLEEWHPIKNGELSPSSVSSGGANKVWWKCKICEYEWVAQIAHRTHGRRTGCPKCKRKKSNVFNSLLSLNPELSKEWNYKKNKGLEPKDFTVNSHKKVWWECKVCGYEWKEVINKRNETDNSCFRCRSLAIKNPELSKEWNYEKNIGLTPYDITYSSGKLVWWKCLQCNYEWEISPQLRGLCPSCTKITLKNGTVCDSLAEAYVYLKYIENKIDVLHNKKYGGTLGQRRYDFYLPKQNEYVEVTSFHKDNHKRNWISYLRNIVIKKRYVENVLKAKFTFYQLVLTKSQINYVRMNMRNH